MIEGQKAVQRRSQINFRLNQQKTVNMVNIQYVDKHTGAHLWKNSRLKDNLLRIQSIRPKQHANVS